MTFVYGCGRKYVSNSTSRHHRAKSRDDGFGTGEALHLLTCGVTSPPACRKVGVASVEDRVTHCRCSSTPRRTPPLAYRMRTTDRWRRSVPGALRRRSSRNATDRHRRWRTDRAETGKNACQAWCSIGPRLRRVPTSSSCGNPQAPFSAVLYPAHQYRYDSSAGVCPMPGCGQCGPQGVYADFIEMRIEHQNPNHCTLDRHFERDQLQNDSLMMHVTPFVISSLTGKHGTSQFSGPSRYSIDGHSSCGCRPSGGSECCRTGIVSWTSSWPVAGDHSWVCGYVRPWPDGTIHARIKSPQTPPAACTASRTGKTLGARRLRGGRRPAPDRAA